MQRFFGLLFLLLAIPVCAQENPRKLRFGGVLDARFISTDDAVSWQDAEFGKLRYGGDGSDRSGLFRISQASFLAQASLNETLSAKLHLNIDAEPDQFDYRSVVDVVEGYVSYRPVLSPFLRLRFRGGIFFPPVSMENTDTAWTSPYTITASAINSWIGEEVRLTGGEAAIVVSRNSQEFVFSGGVFGKNDPAGTLLAWRGWSLSDRQSGYNDRLPLAPIPAIQYGGLFSRQPPWVEPFREVDGRAGYFAHAAWTNRWFDLGAFHYDNRGRPTEFDGEQYAWYTEFNHFGATIRLPANIEIISQILGGDSRMGFSNAVNIHFNAKFILASVASGRHRVSVRYDWFQVDDRDRFKEMDNNQEDGDAWTAAYLIQTGEHHRLAFEVIRMISDRPARAYLALPIHQRELQFQASARFDF